MRFFLEFVSCCASPTQNRLPAEEEERWLVRVPPPIITSRPLCRNRRGRTGPRGHDWRPSLGSISEDIVSSSSSRERTDPCNGAAAAASTSRDVKRKSSGGRGGGGAAAKARHRSYGEGDYSCRGAAMPIIMPTFSPTPFMF